MGSLRRSSAAATRAQRERESVMGKLPKFSLARLVMCGGGYQRLSSQEYLRLGLCLPDSCPDCSEGGSGHYVKNDKMVKNNLLLNNQVVEEKANGRPQQQQLHQAVTSAKRAVGQFVTRRIQSAQAAR